MATQLKNLSDFSNTQLPEAADFTFAIVVSQWNDEITNALYQGAVDFLLKYHAASENILTIHVPGSYELSAAADMILTYKKVDAVICLGCVIQGETRHFDFICNAVANGLTQITIKHNKPVVFGVLTTDSLLQAQERSGGKHGNKGEEAAATAIQMAVLHRSLAQN